MAEEALGERGCRCVRLRGLTRYQKHLKASFCESESVSHSVESDSLDCWTVACRAPLSMGFPRQEYWSGLQFPPPGDLPDPGTELRSPALQADSLLSEPPGNPSVLILRPILGD